MVKRIESYVRIMVQEREEILSQLKFLTLKEARGRILRLCNIGDVLDLQAIKHQISHIVRYKHVLTKERPRRGTLYEL